MFAIRPFAPLAPRSLPAGGFPFAESPRARDASWPALYVALRPLSARRSAVGARYPYGGMRRKSFGGSEVREKGEEGERGDREEEGRGRKEIWSVEREDGIRTVAWILWII